MFLAAWECIWYDSAWDVEVLKVLRGGRAEIQYLTDGKDVHIVPCEVLRPRSTLLSHTDCVKLRTGMNVVAWVEHPNNIVAEKYYRQENKVT